MQRRPLTLTCLAGLLALTLAPAPAGAALDAVPLYEPISIAQLIRPTASM